METYALVASLVHLSLPGSLTIALWRLLAVLSAPATFLYPFFCHPFHLVLTNVRQVWYGRHQPLNLHFDLVRRLHCQQVRWHSSVSMYSICSVGTFDTASILSLTPPSRESTVSMVLPSFSSLRRDVIAFSFALTVASSFGGLMFLCEVFLRRRNGCFGRSRLDRFVSTTQTIFINIYNNFTIIKVN